MSQHVIQGNFVSQVMQRGIWSIKCKYIKLFVSNIKHKENIYLKTNHFVSLPIKVLIAKQLFINYYRM